MDIEGCLQNDSNKSQVNKCQFSNICWHASFSDGIRQDARVNELGTKWEDAVDDNIIKTMKDKDRWRSRTIQLKDMVTTLVPSELSTPGSRYLTVKTRVRDTKNEVKDAMQAIEAEDRAIGLYALQTAPTLPLKCPKFSGKDSECYFSFKEKVL